MLYKMTCPQCNAPMNMDDTKAFMFCPYCGTKVANVAQKIEINQQVNVSGTVMHRTDYSNEPNLYISYSSIDPSVRMLVSIASIRVRKALFLSGQNMSFRLPNGIHEIAFKIGNHNYKRVICIDINKGPVRIYASKAKVAQIIIDAPR